MVGLAGCTSTMSQYSPDQVINNALEETTSLESYYAEVEWKTTEKGKDTEQIFMKEWHSDDGKIRVETKNKEGSEQTIVVNDGHALMTYQVEENQAWIIHHPELIELNQLSQKDQASLFLEIVRDTHEVSVEGEEKIIGRATYHLVAEAKADSSLFGDMELWVDKENWRVLKMILHTGDTKDEILYTKIDFSEKISSHIFTLDLPEDVDLQNVEDISQTIELTLDEVAEQFTQPIFYFPEKTGLEISAIELVDMQSELFQKEVSFDYTKDDLPLLTLSVFESTEESQDEAFVFPGEETVTVRNQEGFYSEFSGIRTLQWQEEGLSYSIMIIDPNVTIEDLQELADEMIIAE